MWEKGKINGYTFEMKRFINSSHMGINRGRISKMVLYNKDDKCVFTYDRGIDIDANGRDKIILKRLLKKYNKRTHKTKKALDFEKRRKKILTDYEKKYGFMPKEEKTNRKI